MEIRKIYDSKEDFEKVVSKLESIIGDKFGYLFESKDDLKSEIALILLEKKEKLLKAPNLRFGYLVATVKNALQDKFVKKKRLLYCSFSDSFESDKENDDKGYSFEELIKDESIPEVVKVLVFDYVKFLKERLKDSELEVLCYRFWNEIYKREENPFLKDKSENAKHKAWSRLRPKISELLSDFSEEELILFIRVFMSEVCQRNR
ncbi:MAG: hypothetical protein ABGX27_09300 [Desulfurobacteriaceae bacterium]